MEQEFFTNNDIYVNKLILKNYFGALLVAPMILLGKFAGVFRISYSFIFMVFILSLFITLVQFILTRTEAFSSFTKYFGIIMYEVFLAFLGTNSTIGIYISYAVVPFLSCLYFNLKVTTISCICGYLLMLMSLYYKSFEEVYELAEGTAPMDWFVPVSAGFTIEFIFVFLTTRSLCRRLMVLLDRLYNQNVVLNKFQLKMITGFANLVESRDTYTGEHVKRTSTYVKLIVNKLREKGLYLSELTDETAILYEIAAPLHDMGKIKVPDYILNKNGKFTLEEFEIMKQHPVYSAEIIETNMSGIERDQYLKIALDMALYHHEKWDGTGYPRRLKGEQIPLAARVMAAADVLDALLSKRQYKEAFSLEETFRIFRDSRGKHFEPCIVDCVLDLKEEIKLVASS